MTGFRVQFQQGDCKTLLFDFSFLSGSLPLPHLCVQVKWRACMMLRHPCVQSVRLCCGRESYRNTWSKKWSVLCSYTTGTTSQIPFNHPTLTWVVLSRTKEQTPTHLTQIDAFIGQSQAYLQIEVKVFWQMNKCIFFYLGLVLFPWFHFYVDHYKKRNKIK